MNPKPHVGTLRERPLHAALKRWYARDGDRVEHPVDGYVIDLVRDDLLIEIQTRGFSSMKGKLQRLLADGHRVHIVYPVAVEKWLVKVDEEGEIISRRKSPKRGREIDVCAELVSFPDLLAHPNLTVEVLLTKQEEQRHHDENRAWRRKGWVVDERRLLEVTASVELVGPHSLTELLPPGLPDRFTTADLADGLGCSRRRAQQLAYCLRLSGAAEIVDKAGRSILYRLRG